MRTLTLKPRPGRTIYDTWLTSQMVPSTGWWEDQVGEIEWFEQQSVFPPLGRDGTSCANRRFLGATLNK